MGKWKPDGRGGKIFVGAESQHSSKLPSMNWLREQVPIRELIQMLGLKQRGKYVHCWHPEKHNHGDRTPSVGIDVRRNKAHCFACGFDHSTIDLVMDVKGMTARQAALWLASIWTSAVQVQQKYQVSERIKMIGGVRTPTHEWSKLKPKQLKKREKGYVEQLVGSRSWRTLKPATEKVILTLLIHTDPKMMTVTISSRELSKLVGIRRSAVIRANRTIEQLGLYATETAYDKVKKKNKTTLYRLTWYSHAWQSWLRGKLTSTTTPKATFITVSHTDQEVESEGGPQMPLMLPISGDLLSGGSPAQAGQ
jgi:CHC2 zinc finger